MEKSLTAAELDKILKGNVYLVEARVNSDYQFLLNIVRNHQGLSKALIFYQTGFNPITLSKIGHWVCLFIRNKNVYFFDSMGIYPDDQLNYIETHETKNRFIGHILYFLATSGYTVFYNDIKFQKPDTNTCGRYCAIFLNELTQYDEPYVELRSRLNKYKNKKDEFYDKAVVKYFNLLYK